MMRHALLLAAALAAASPAPSAAPSADLAQVQRHFQAVDTMTADFTQTDRDGKTLTGAITLKRPGRIRFQYQAGVPLLIVGDGTALTMIDYQVAQVSRWPIGDSPLSVLLDPKADMTRFAHILPSDDPARLLIEAKDPRHPEYGTITIGFARVPAAPGGLMLQGWSTLDAQNNRSVIRLANQRFNVAVSDKAFLWNDPRKRNPSR